MCYFMCPSEVLSSFWVVSVEDEESVSFFVYSCTTGLIFRKRIIDRVRENTEHRTEEGELLLNGQVGSDRGV